MNRPGATCGRANGRALRTAMMGAAALISVGGYPHAAIAQDNQIETIIVTAEKRAADINKVPVTVQAISGDDLARQGIRDVKSALPFIPGASLAGETSQGTQVYQLRGVSTGDTTGDPTVASYLDDFPFSIPGVPFAAPSDLFDLQRLEVLKGPQGTLYGSSSLGGVIKVVTNDPDTSAFDVRAAASFGAVSEHGYDYSADLMVNLPLDDTFAIRGVMSGKHLSGYSFVPALGIRNGNNDDTVTGRIKALWQPTERLSFLVSYWRFDDQQDFTNRMDGYDPPMINDVGFGKSPTSFSLYTGKITYDFDFATLTSTSGYISRHNGLTANGCQIDTCFVAEIPGTSNSFVQEVRLSSNGDGPLHWIGGVYYQYGESSSNTLFHLTGISNPDIFIDGLSAVHSIEWAGFGEVSYDLWGGLIRPLVGIRYSSVKRNLIQNSTTTVTSVPPVVVGSSDTQAGKNYHLNPRFNVAIHPNDNGMVYFNAAQGFRPGALQTAANVAALQAVTGVVTDIQLKTDSLWSYEIGTKWSLFDNALNVNGAVYMIKWDEAQYQTGLSGIAGIVNLGDVSGHGIDLQIAYATPIPGLILQASGGWNSTTIESINPMITAGLPFLHNGVQVPNVPKGNFSLGFNYARPLGYRDLILIADATYQYRAKESDLATGLRSGDLNIISFEIGVEKDAYQIQFFADNITDERGPSLWEQGRMIVPRPRTLGMRLSFSPEL